MNDCTKQSSSHFLKNPAAGGGVRSSSSPHQPAVGTPPNQDSPFVRAIIALITSKAKEDGVKVIFGEVRKFAREHAEAYPPRNPPKGKIFGQDHVDAALERFKEQYVLPQPAPEPTHRLSQRDQLIRKMCEMGMNALPLPLQLQFRTFKIMHSLCFLTEELTHAKLMNLQASLCTNSKGVLLAVVTVDRDPTSETGLHISMYRQSMKYGGIYRGSFHSAITIVCVSCYGSERTCETIGEMLVDFSEEDDVSRSCIEYGPGYNWSRKDCEIGAYKRDLKDRRDQLKFIPSSIDSFANRSTENDPVFQSFAVRVMTDSGCVFLPPFSAPVTTEVHAPSVEVAGEASIEALMITCHHGNYVKSFGKYESCQSCLSNPGKDTIVDGWGNVVGYHKPF